MTLNIPTSSEPIAGETRMNQTWYQRFVELFRVSNALPTTYQPLDSDLTTIAGLTATTNNVIQSVSSAWASRTPAQLVATIAAAQADQETAASTTVTVTPGVQQFHPSACKQWVRFDSTGAIAASYNTASITDNGVGNWYVNIGTDMSSANYCALACGGYITTGNVPIVYNVGVNVDATKYQILGWQAVTTLGDPTNLDAIFGCAFGDQ